MARTLNVPQSQARDLVKAPLLILLGLTLLLDAPWGRAFYDYTPWTETLGFFLFRGLHESVGLSWFALSPFEAVACLMAAVAVGQAVARGRARLPGAFFALVLMAPLIMALGYLIGLFQGHEFSLALTQTRPLAMMPVFLLLGWYGFGTAAGLWAVFTLVLGVMVAKCLQAIYAHMVVFGGGRGDREFLIEHITSDFISTALVALAAWALVSRRPPMVRVAAFLGGGIPLLYVFLLNSRRTAVVGLGLAVMLGFFVVPRDWYRRLLPGALALGLLLLALVAVTWDAEGPVGFAARTVRSLLDPAESSAGYRRIENANLLSVVAGSPLLGMGFGRRFPLVYPMPDISSIYAGFDLIPHNTLLFLWAYVGPLGFALFGTLAAMTTAAAGRVMRVARDPRVVAAGAVVFIMIVKWLVYVYADLGLAEVRAMALVGLVAGGVWRLARETGSDAGAKA